MADCLIDQHEKNPTAVPYIWFHSLHNYQIPWCISIDYDAVPLISLVHSVTTFFWSIFVNLGLALVAGLNIFIIHHFSHFGDGAIILWNWDALYDRRICFKSASFLPIKYERVGSFTTADNTIFSKEPINNKIFTIILFFDIHSLFSIS